MKDKNISTSRTTFTFKSPFDGKPEKDVNVVAYAFDRTGKLLDSAPVKNGKAEMALTPAAAANMRLFFGPPAPPGGKEPELKDMERLQAYEPLWKPAPGKFDYELLPIPELNWKWWVWCQCRVRGRVVKNVEIAGMTVQQPVCSVRVHICEVDPLLFRLRRLPRYELLKLRDDILVELQKPIPFPPKERPPQMSPPRPRTMGSSPVPTAARRFAATSAAVQMAAPSAAGATAVNPQPEPGAKAFELLPAATRLNLLSTSAELVRATLIENPYLILPYLCFWPWWWPWFCTKQELTTVATGEGGRFDAVIWYRCFGDHPDLYFWVECLIDGVWTTVHKPIVCCNTWWNYVCGTEVTIAVNDPRVPACGGNPDLPGMTVVMKSIGNAISVSEIQHAAGASRGLTTDGRPLCATLELRLNMSRQNLIDAGVAYYRWSYRRVTEGDGVTAVTDDWHRMTRPVYRYYVEYVPDPANPPFDKPVYTPDPMGPVAAFPGEYLFRIQPRDPPAGEWEAQNEHVDLAWAYFETASLTEPDPDNPGETIPQAGQFELMLELFKSDGTRVNWNDIGGAPIGIYESTSPAPFTPEAEMTTAPAPADRIVVEGGNTVAYRFFVHVDNFRCEADIYETWVDVAENAAGPCGFIHFDALDSTARLSFRAYQRYGFATFHFEVDKGSSGAVAIATTPGWPRVHDSPVACIDPAGEYTRNAATSIHSEDFTVEDLLDGCPEAAFSETLYVNSTATDGYQDADWLDAWGVPKAFALAKAPPTP